MSLFRKTSTFALVAALGAVAPGVAHARSIDPVPPGGGSCAAVGHLTENDKNVAEYENGIGNWKFGLKYHTDVGFGSDCNASKASANAGFDVTMLGITVPALDFSLWAGTDKDHHNSLSLSIYAARNEIRTIELAGSNGDLGDSFEIDESFPGTADLNGDYDFSDNLGAYKVKAHVDWGFDAHVKATFEYVATRKRLYALLEGDVNLSAHVDGSVWAEKSGHKYGETSISASAIGLIAKAKLEAEAKAFRYLENAPPNAMATMAGPFLGGGPPIDMDNAWMVDLLARREIKDALHGKATLAVNTEIPIGGGNTIPVEFSQELFDVGGVPASVKVPKSKAFQGHYFFTF